MKKTRGLLYCNSGFYVFKSHGSDSNGWRGEFREAIYLLSDAVDKIGVESKSRLECLRLAEDQEIKDKLKFYFVGDFILNTLEIKSIEPWRSEYPRVVFDDMGD